MKRKTVPRLAVSLLLVAGTAFLSGCNKDDGGGGSAGSTTPVDSTTNTTEITFGTATDQNDNSFKTVTIGSQTWMAENLKVTDYNDGTAIPNVTDGGTWAALTTGAQCTYNNTTDTATINSYGRLYNWYAVDTASNGGKNICPAGWHVPTDAESTLENYLIANGYNYDSTTTGNKIAKALASTTGWNESSSEGTPGYNPSTNNSSGFNALPSGYRSGGNGSFYDSGGNGFWWSSTENNSTFAYGRNLNYGNSTLNRGSYGKHYGFSVRCIKN